MVVSFVNYFMVFIQKRDLFKFLLEILNLLAEIQIINNTRCVRAAALTGEMEMGFKINVRP